MKPPGAPIRGLRSLHPTRPLLSTAWAVPVHQPIPRHGRPTSRRGFASVSAAELRFGQPVHETHPHILRAGERA